MVEDMFLVLVCHREALLGVVLVDEIEEDRVRLPEHEVSVLVVDDRRDAPVRVVVDVRGLLLLLLAEVEINRLVGQSELFENDRDFPSEIKYVVVSVDAYNARELH